MYSGIFFDGLQNLAKDNTMENYVSYEWKSKKEHSRLSYWISGKLNFRKWPSILPELNLQLQKFSVMNMSNLQLRSQDDLISCTSTSLEMTYLEKLQIYSIIILKTSITIVWSIENVILMMMTMMMILDSSSWAWFFSIFFIRKFHIELCHSRPTTYLQHLKKLQFLYMISINYILTSK